MIPELFIRSVISNEVKDIELTEPPPTGIDISIDIEENEEQGITKACLTKKNT